MYIIIIDKYLYILLVIVVIMLTVGISNSYSNKLHNKHSFHLKIRSKLINLTINKRIEHFNLLVNPLMKLYEIFKSMFGRNVRYNKNTYLNIEKVTFYKNMNCT